MPILCQSESVNGCLFSTANVFLMQTFLAWLAFLGFLPLIVRAMAKGTLSPGIAAVLALVVVVAVRVGVRRFYSRVVLPIVGVVLAAAQYSHGDTDSFWAILSGLLTMSLMMLGFYLMIAGFFRGHGHRGGD
jgi:general stress protein CsbA